MARSEADLVIILEEADLVSETGQFGASTDVISDTIFLGIGGERPVGGDFSIGGAISTHIPFRGQTEIARAEVDGSVTGRFGLEFSWSLDPGLVTTTQPYDFTILAPGDLVSSGESYRVSTAAVLDVDDPDGGYITEFPRLTVTLDLIMELAAQLEATFGVLGNNRTLEIFDFEVGVEVPIFDLDTQRDGNEFEILGLNSEEIIRIVEDTPEGEEPVTQVIDGEFVVEFTDVFGSERHSEQEDVPIVEDNDGEPLVTADVSTTQNIDLGRLILDVPDFQVQDAGFDGTSYVTDTDTNSENIVEIILDVDGIATQATGGSFPPLELTSSSTIEVGPATIEADFSYNLIDVELVGGLPLVQFFTVTPEVQTQINFFDVDGNALEVEILTTRNQVTFNTDGVFQSEAVAARLRELGESNARFATDIGLFVDFDDGIPGAFTGETASLAGAVVSRELDANGNPISAFSRLDNREVVGTSEPLFGEDQFAPVPVPATTEFAYLIAFPDPNDPATEIQEFIPLGINEFDVADSIWVLDQFTTGEFRDSTGWYDDQAVFDIRYQEDTVVEIESRSGGTVRNQTGLGLTLDLDLQGLAASADFDIEVDLGVFDFGTDFGFEIDELFQERFPVFDFTDPDEILTLFDETFEIDIESVDPTLISTFTVGGAIEGEDVADHRGTDDADTLRGGIDAELIVGQAGDDLLQGLRGDDTIQAGTGQDTLSGSIGTDRADFSDFAGERVALNPETNIFEFPVFNGVALFEDVGYDINSRTATTIVGGEVNRLISIEEIIGTNFSDRIVADGGITFVDGGGSIDVIEVVTGGVTARGGAGNDSFVEVTSAGRSTTYDGGLGSDAIRYTEAEAVTADLLQTGGTSDSFVSIERVSLTDFGDTFRDNDEGHLIDADRSADGAGDDLVFGRGGSDTINGGAGDDTISGGSGADRLDGGEGRDRLTYEDAETSVFVRLQPELNGLAPGNPDFPDFTGRGFRGDAQGDQLSRFEDVEGTAFDDIIFGDGAENLLLGGRGDDRLAAQGGNDSLFGQAGDDILWRGDRVGNEFVGGDNLFNGGGGFDIVAFDYDDEFNFEADATARFLSTTNDPFINLVNEREDVTVTGTLEITTSVNAVLGAGGADGVATITQNAVDVTSSAGRFFANMNFDGVSFETQEFDRSPPIGTDFRVLIPAQTVEEEFTFSTADDFVASIASSSFDIRNGEQSGRATSETAVISEIRDIDNVTVNGQDVSTDVLIGTDILRGVEGLIGGSGRDTLFGNDAANALFGGGDDDLVIGAGGDDVLGFGTAQPLVRLLSFSGGTFNNNVGNVVRQPLAFERVLAGLNPEADRADIDALNFATLEGLAGTRAFLWGGAGSDTIDMRFDRGLEFFPEDSDRTLSLTLEVDDVPDSVINSFTGETLVYGTATLGEGTPNSERFEDALLFGIENVIGTSGDDTITGSRGDNIIDGGGGSDILDGGAGHDTLSLSEIDGADSLAILVTLNDNEDDRLDMQVTANVDGEADVTTAANFETVSGGVADVVTLTIAAGATGATSGPNRDRLTADLSGVGGGDLRGFVAHPEFDRTFVLQDSEVTVDVDGLVGNFHITTGDFDDFALTTNAGFTINLGGGNDTTFNVESDLVYFDPLTGATQDNDPGQLLSRIDGGDGFDDALFLNPEAYTVVLQDDRVIVRELIDESLYEGLSPEVAEAVSGTTLRTIYTNVEFFDFLGLTGIDLRNVDPVVGPDRLLRLTEDENDPVPVGVRLTAEEIASGQTFTLTDIPSGGSMAVISDSGARTEVAVGDSLTADEVLNLHFVTDQSYRGETGAVSFEIDGEVDDDGAPVTFSEAVPLARGVSLGLDAPFDPNELAGEVRLRDLGLTITVDEVPTSGTVFFLEETPPRAGFGDPQISEVAVSAGDLLTPDQVAGLRFRPDAHSSEAPGAFTYTVRDAFALDAQPSNGPRIIDQRDDAADRDGVATQTITFDVTPAADAPISSDQVFEFSPGIVFDDQLAGEDPDGDAVRFELVEGPATGRVLVSAVITDENGDPVFREANDDLGALTLGTDGGFDYVPPAEGIFGNGEVFFETTFSFRVVESGPSGRASPVQTATLRVFNPAEQIAFVVDPDDPAQQVDPDPDDGSAPDTSLRELGGRETSDVILGHAGADDLSGLGGADSIEGREGDDALNGGEDDDSLFGGDDDDTLEGGEGGDYLHGGEGLDLASYREAEARVRVDIGGAVASLGDAAGDVFVEVEGAIGTDFDDFLLGRFIGNDLLIGGLGDDRLIGRSGDDTLLGGAGADTHIGGAGFDFASYADADARVRADLSGVVAGLGDAAGDEFSGMEGLIGSGFDDFLLGGGGAERLIGGGGDDRLVGRGGDDTLEGGSGADAYIGGSGFDFVSFVGAEGAVRLDFSGGLSARGDAAGDTFSSVEGIEGSAFGDFLIANDDGVALSGLGGGDILRGGAGDDTLTGGEGADQITGGLGSDILTGGEGADRFFFTDIADSAAGAERDVITDFDAASGDRIKLDQIDANALLAGNQDFVFIRERAFDGVAGEIRLTGSDGNVLLQADVDGDAIADFEIELRDVTDLTGGFLIL